MKLKRCPNSHYYDGDKYDKCPHCSASSEPAPAPKPVFEPAPVPQEEPKPQTAPAPQPAPQAAPQPAPQPPKPAPVPQPAPEVKPEPASADGWTCSCGGKNTGRFCSLCGKPKPEPVKAKTEGDTWKCQCGTENTGKFCYQCGARRPETAAAPEVKPEPAHVPQPAPKVNPEPAPVPQTTPEVRPEPAPVPQLTPEVRPEPAPVPQPTPEVRPEPAKAPTLTQEINEARFTGNLDDAKSRAGARDEGATQIIFDEIGDDLVLGWLTMTNSSGKGKVFTLTDAKNTIGRSDPENKVDIDLRNDRSISRGAQATIVYDPLNKKFFLQSAGGKSFVYVNRELVLTFNELKPYDIIRIGETELVFVPLCCDKFSW